MMFENEVSAATIAAELGLSLEGYAALKEVLEPIQSPVPVRLITWQVEHDRDGRDLWEVEIAGKLTLPDVAEVFFLFRVLVVDQEIRTGISKTPDWYKVFDAAGDILFEGDVEVPDNADDTVGRARYGTWAPVRQVAYEAAFARLATGRPVIDGG